MIDTGMGWAIFGVLFIFIFILLGILGESQRQKAKLAKQEIESEYRRPDNQPGYYPGKGSARERAEDKTDEPASSAGEQLIDGFID